MAMNPPIQSPTNPHFFQPLLPGSDTHLTIPAAFFSKYIQGNKEQKTATLRSDASDKTWQVNIEGRTLTGGWKDFATAHDLRIGNVIVFKHEGNMVFHVPPFGPSCCEIQYAQCQCPIIEGEDDNNENQKNIGNVLRKKKPECSLSYDYCFVAEVTASNKKSDKLNLPVEAASSNALNRRCHKMIVVNEDGKSWTLNLSFEESDKSYHIRGGWRTFCGENRLKVGDSVLFNLVGDGKTTPMIFICPKEECSELMSKYKSKKAKMRPNWVASSSSRQNRFVTIILTRYNIQNSRLILPNVFVKIKGINKHKKIILMDKHGVKRLTNLLTNGRKQRSRGLGKGWKDFCEANDVLRIGKPFELELIWEDEIPVLKFCSKVKIESICV